MNIFAKILSPVLKPIIKNAIEEKMKDIPVGDIFNQVWPEISKWGAKFFIALLSIVALAAMAYLKIPLSEYMALPGIVFIAIGFFITRRQQEIGVGKAQDKARADILASKADSGGNQ